MKQTPFNSSNPLYTQALVNRGIFELWHDKEYTDYEGDPFAVETVQNHINDVKQTKGLLLHGSNGTGKTMLMNVGFKHAFTQGRECMIIDFRELVKEYTKSWRDSGRFNSLMKVSLLGIDDVGKEFSSDMSKELAETALDHIIRYRFQRMLPTWITTNLALSSFKTEYSEHIASLLKRSMASLAIVGKDYGDKLFTKYERKK